MADENAPGAIHRRTFLKNSVLVCGFVIASAAGAIKVMAGDMFQRGSKVQPLTKVDRTQMIRQVLLEASRSKNMPSAIEKYGAALSPNEKNILLGLSREELTALESIYRKVALH